MSRHASAQKLAHYREGVTSRRKAARIAGHLATCSVCAEVDAQLARVATVLAQAETPPMPDALAERIELALAVEHAERGASASRQVRIQGAGSPDGGTARDPGRLGPPGRSSRKPWRVRVPDLTSPRLVRGLAAATGAVLLLGGVGYVIASRVTPPAKVASRAAAAAPTPIHARPVPAFSNSSLSVGTRQLSYARHGKTFTYTAAASNENFTSANLAGNIRARLTTYAKNVPTTMPAAGSGTSPVPSPTGIHKGGDIGGIAISRLGGCMSRVATGRQVLLAVVARYEGVPATIIVLEPLSGSSRLLDVIVVGVACSASDADVITQTTMSSG